MDTKVAMGIENLITSLTFVSLDLQSFICKQSPGLWVERGRKG